MKHNALNDCQHGFRKGRSTETALLIQKELIINNLEEGNLVLGIFIDYSKAFDCLQHKTFLTELTAYGVREVAHSLMCSYLLDRCHRK